MPLSSLPTRRRKVVLEPFSTSSALGWLLARVVIKTPLRLVAPPRPATHYLGRDGGANSYEPLKIQQLTRHLTSLYS